MVSEKKYDIIHTLMLVMAAFFWGTTFVAQSIGADYVGAYTYLASRSWIAVAVLLPVMKIFGKEDPVSYEKEEFNIGKIRLSRIQYKLIGGCACGLFLFTASGLQQIGMAYTTTAKAGFITALYVVFVPVAYLFTGGKVSSKIWLCVIMAVIGLYLLCMNDTLSLNFGDGIILISSFFFTLQIITVNYFVRKINALILSWTQFLFTAIVSTIVMFIFEQVTAENIINAFPAILYAGIFSSGVAYTLQILGQKGLNPTIASIAMSLESVFSAVSGWIILGEKMTFKECTGAIIMFLAIIISQIPLKRKASL
ncbi:MAG: DMT family transporter [Lachnospiraceae bacterium]|nr:DMT family transporter [Lachnospiraceae bacterium]